MIYNYKQYESIFFKTIDDKLKSIEDLIAKLKICKEDISAAWDKHENDPRHVDLLFGNVPLNKLNNIYKYFFKTRNKVVFKFNSIFEFTLRKQLNQENINAIVNAWKDFEITIAYGSYNMTMRISRIYANNFIIIANDFLKELNELKEEYDIDLDTEDPFVLTKRNDNFVTPCRKSFDEEKKLNLKNKYNDVDPLGEEEWGD